jgi:chromate transporter
MLAVWVLFLPSFLWIFLGAPHAERLRANRRLAGALAGVSVAVVGVIANFALWFASHSLFALHRPVAGLAAELPVPGSLDPVALGLALGALLALAAFRVPVGRLLAGCALAGLVLGLAGLA